jgi:hypothetical protein
MERSTTRRPRGGGLATARSAIALVLIALTGCYHTSTYRLARDAPEGAERVPDGSHVALQPADGEKPVVRVEEQAMCRNVEWGTRQIVTVTTQTKEPFNLSGLGGLGGGGAVGAAVIILVVIPAVIVGSFVYAVLPNQTKYEQPSPVPPEPYRKWRNDRTTCSDAPRPLPGFPLRLITRLDESDCLEWRASTSSDGTLALPPVLARAKSTKAACDRPVEAGCLWIEAAEPSVELPVPDERPVAHRTHRATVFALEPTVLASLGLSVAPRSGPCAVAAESSDPYAGIISCVAQLGAACRAELDACLIEAEERGNVEGGRDLCWYATLRCDSRGSAFDLCMNQ